MDAEISHRGSAEWGIGRGVVEYCVITRCTFLVILEIFVK